MNPPKCKDEDYINFLIATPRQVSATEAARVHPEQEQAPAHDAFTRLLQRLEPEPETLWHEAQTQVCLDQGILVLDDSTLDKPYAKKRELVGNFKNAGAKWDRTPTPVNYHDFRSQAEGVAILYGIFDPQANRGALFVGVSHETSAFAVSSIRGWWLHEGRKR